MMMMMMIIIIIIIIINVGHLSLFRFKIYFLKLMNLFGYLTGFLGRGIGPTQGLYLHKTTQYIKRGQTHPYL
jgi:hypothetical protein